MSNWGPPPPPHWPPPSPPKRRTWLWVVIGVVLALAVIAAVGSAAKPKPAGSSASSDTDSDHPLSHPEDVAITRCSTDEYGFVVATVVVTNQSSKASTYAVTIAFDSKTSHQQIGTGYVSADHLAPGQSTAPQQATTGQTPPAGGFTCRVVQSDRLAS